MFSTPLSDLAQETLPKLSVIVGLAEGVYCIRHNGYSGAHVQGRVLVVDDNVMVRESYTELLRGRGYEVEQAGDGEQALAVMRSKQMDLAIVDVMMPSMGGLELRQRLDESSPKVATILVTGQPARVEELVEDDPDFVSGKISILYKPVHPVKLLAEVDKHLQPAP